MTSHVDAAVQTFLSGVRLALAGLKSDLVALPNPELEPMFDSRQSHPSLSPASQAMGRAARAICDAERNYAQGCLTALDGEDVSAQSVIDASDAGDAIIRFAVAAFKEIIGKKFVYDFTTKQLFEHADRLAAPARAGQRGGPGARIAADLAPRGPRMSPLG